MSVSLTREQRQAVLESGGGAVEVVDESLRCVLVPADEYERMKRLLEAEEIDPSFFEFDDEDCDPRSADNS